MSKKLAVVVSIVGLSKYIDNTIRGLIWDSSRDSTSTGLQIDGSKLTVSSESWIRQPNDMLLKRLEFMKMKRKYFFIARR